VEIAFRFKGDTVFSKWITKRIVEPMVLRFLKKHDLTMCKMCDNLAHIDHGTCEYCDYELDMMAKEEYAWRMMYDE
tara:strand:+ start:210 stop:437 length:228 start_codon:yes stop_codon:yes gene_type:complete